MIRALSVNTGFAASTLICAVEIKTKELLQIMVHQATTFLTEMEGFWPFGGVVNGEGFVVPLTAYPGGNQPDSADVLALLEKGIAAKFGNEEITAAAIVSDTDYRETPASERAQALKIRLLVPPAAPEDHYYLYRVEVGQVVLYDYIIHRPVSGPFR
ncbi:hypothetical protein ACFQT0_14700 [Hymenobacter humi]|uniref:Uncharacterized protein n=1 Tax=Hymenobacter humi TaxID=1411620 RepID=A0ABW2U7N2_9BACT